MKTHTRTHTKHTHAQQALTCCTLHARITQVLMGNNNMLHNYEPLKTVKHCEGQVGGICCSSGNTDGVKTHHCLLYYNYNNNNDNNSNDICAMLF